MVAVAYPHLVGIRMEGAAEMAAQEAPKAGLVVPAVMEAMRLDPGMVALAVGAVRVARLMEMGAPAGVEATAVRRAVPAGRAGAAGPGAVRKATAAPAGTAEMARLRVRAARAAQAIRQGATEAPEAEAKGLARDGVG